MMMNWLQNCVYLLYSFSSLLLKQFDHIFSSSCLSSYRHQQASSLSPEQIFSSTFYQQISFSHSDRHCYHARYHHDLFSVMHWQDAKYSFYRINLKIPEYYLISLSILQDPQLFLAPPLSADRNISTLLLRDQIYNQFSIACIKATSRQRCKWNFLPINR